MLMWMYIFFLLSPGAVSRPRVADTVVGQLYSYVVAHHPIGIPVADRAALWPLLSKRLVQKLETARACEDDYRRQHAGDDGKPAFGWLETGLFSGSDERALPSEVSVERSESKSNGTVLVYVRFTYRETSDTYGRSPNPATVVHWRGAAVVTREGGYFVVDDVLLFKRHATTVESRLSRTFVGCSGRRWVGGLH
jgi:hypothetical protein